LKAHDYKIAPSTYYASKSRPPSCRDIEDERLTELVRRLHKDNYSCYGIMKMWHFLKNEGEGVGRDQTARLLYRVNP